MKTHVKSILGKLEGDEPDPGAELLSAVGFCRRKRQISHRHRLSRVSVLAIHAPPRPT